MVFIVGRISCATFGNVQSANRRTPRRLLSGSCQIFHIYWLKHIICAGTYLVDWFDCVQNGTCKRLSRPVEPIWILNHLNTDSCVCVSCMRRKRVFRFCDCFFSVQYDPMPIYKHRYFDVLFLNQSHLRSDRI